MKPGFEVLRDKLNADIEKFGAYAENPAFAPELFGISGEDEVRRYYTVYSGGMKHVLETLKPSMENDDLNGLRTGAAKDRQ